MSRDNGSSSDPTASSAFQEAFEPSAATLLDLWMSISDSRSTLDRSVQELRHNGENPTLTEMETELERMDSLIFESMEKVDDLFTLIRNDLASRKASVDAGGRKETGTSLVDELDAYLDGAFDRLERPPRLNSGTQTDPVLESSASPRASLFAVQKDAPSIEFFDLLSKRVQRMKLEIKTEASATTPWGKKTSKKKAKRRTRSPSPSVTSMLGSDSDLSMDSSSTPTKERKKKRRHSHSSYSEIKGRHPLEVCGFRTENGMREYAIQYDGVDHLTWVTLETATKRATAMIHEYNQLRQKKVKAVASAALRSEGAASGKAIDLSEESEAEPMYIVDKIIDHRFRHGKKEYFVKWEGYESDENTWEPAPKLRREVRGIVDEYEREIAEKASRKEAKVRQKEAKTRALMQTKAAMQAKVDALSSKLAKSSREASYASPPSYPAKRLPKMNVGGKGSRSIASTEEEDDSYGELRDDSNSNDVGSNSSDDDEHEVQDLWARAQTHFG